MEKDFDYKIIENTLYMYPNSNVLINNTIFSRLKKENYLKNLDKDIFVEKLAEYNGDLNALHPFREGNGRTQRIFINYIANLSGYELDFELVEKEEILLASIDSFYAKYDKYISIFNRILKKIE